MSACVSVPADGPGKADGGTSRNALNFQSKVCNVTVHVVAPQRDF